MPDSDINRLFVGDQGDSLALHLHALTTDPDKYISQLNSALSKVDMNSATKGRAIAALWISGHRASVDDMLAMPDGVLSPSDIARAVKLLDAPREVRHIERKLNVLESGGMRVPASHVRKVKARLNDLTAEQCHITHGSASRGFANRLRRWIQDIPKERLEQYLMDSPTEPWKHLIDTVKTQPSDFQLDYFQSVVLGKAPAPEGSVVNDIETVTPATVDLVMATHPQLFSMYSVIRKKIPPDEMPLRARHLIAARAPMEDVLCFYEDLAQHSPDPIDAAIHARLTECSNKPNVKLHTARAMERMVKYRASACSFVPLLMPVANNKLGELHYFRESVKDLKCAVLGDASGSMSASIATATILSSLLSVCLDSDLRFFNHGDQAMLQPPRSAEQVFETTERIQASGMTAPAASMVPYLKSRQHVDLFVCVTDELENTASQGMHFSDAFARYREQVNPNAQLFLVSLLQGNDTGTMFRRLQTAGLRSAVTQYRMDGSRPDLGKFDSLLGVMANSLGRNTVGHEPEPNVVEVPVKPSVKHSEPNHIALDLPVKPVFLAAPPAVAVI